MTEPTITIPTGDHGPVTVTEPPWCTAAQHPAGIERSAIAHTGPSINVTVSTVRGPRRLLELLMWQEVFPTPAAAHSDDVHVVAQFLDGDRFGYDVIGLENLATDLMEAAAKVRRVARRLSLENRGEAR